MADFFAKGNKPINGYGGVNEGVIYSTEEHIIGKWIDGSNLYEKTVDCGALPNATSKMVAHSISNISKIVSIIGFAYSSGTSVPLPRGGVSPIDVYADTTYINIVAPAGYTSYNGYVTLRYTKTS